jgi:hypothetical protein
LYLDNTFLKKKFLFPPQKEVLKDAINFIQGIIDEDKHTRIFVGLDNYGK